MNWNTRLRPGTGAAAARIALSSYVQNGLCAAVGLLLITGLSYAFIGSFASSVAAIGVMVVVPPDLPAPRRGKFWQCLPSVLIGIPLFGAVRLLHADAVYLGMLLVSSTFLAFLGAAWGRRGLPLSMSAMFAVVFSLAVPPRVGGEAAGIGYFALGALAYLVFATGANSLLNARYRSQILAETLLAMASMMRSQARQFSIRNTALEGMASGGESNPIGRLLREQAVFADQLQSARDMLLESPRTPRRQQLAGMLMRVLEMRDQLLACELDVDFVAEHRSQEPVLAALRRMLNEHAGVVDGLADSLLRGRRAQAFAGNRDRLSTLPWETQASQPQILARGLAARVLNIDDEIALLSALARGEAQPELSRVDASWHLFISPVTWSWQPFTVLWHWDAPPLRHALRAAMAIATAYGISLIVPWRAHAYWLFLTIVVVLRGSLAQTLERRNSRVAGTVVGSALAGLILALAPPSMLVRVVVTLAQGVAHAFAVRRYLVTAVAATLLALLQAHLLNSTISSTAQAFERIADTLIGVGVAWAFSYVLPAWERTQIPALVRRALEAQSRNAQSSLALDGLEAPDAAPELEWRFARREAYDSLSALVQAIQRCLAEPRAVRPPLVQLGRLVTHSYQLLAQLTAVKTMLLLRRERLDASRCEGPLRVARQNMTAILAPEGGSPHDPGARPRVSAASPVPDPLSLPDPFQDVTPWVLRRLALATQLAQSLQDDAQHVIVALRT